MATTTGTNLGKPATSYFCTTADQAACDTQPVCCTEEEQTPPTQAAFIAQHGGMGASTPALPRGMAMQLLANALPIRLATNRNKMAEANLFISHLGPHQIRCPWSLRSYTVRPLCLSFVNDEARTRSSR